MPRLSLVLGSLALAGCSLFNNNVYELEVGDCFNDDGIEEGATEAANVSVVDCEQAHGYEVFAAFEMTAASYPGAATTRGIAVDGCLERFDAFVGLPYQQSALEVTSLHPTRQTWDDGDREILCALYRLDLQDVTDSLEGSAQ